MSALLDYPQRHAITAEEYLRMGDSGVFAPEARLELVDGEIIEMAPIGSPHASTVATLGKLLTQAVGSRALVWVQNPLIVDSRSVPQPDVALLKPRSDNYWGSHPTASDVLLVIEVSETTLRFDLAVKTPMYARAGIAETWVVDLDAQLLRVFRDPDAEGYRTTLTASGGESVSAGLLPEATVEVAALFPG